MTIKQLISRLKELDDDPDVEGNVTLVEASVWIGTPKEEKFIYFDVEGVSIIRGLAAISCTDWRYPR